MGLSQGFACRPPMIAGSSLRRPIRSYHCLGTLHKLALGNRLLPAGPFIIPKRDNCSLPLLARRAAWQVLLSPVASR